MLQLNWSIRNLKFLSWWCNLFSDAIRVQIKGTCRLDWIPLSKCRVSRVTLPIKIIFFCLTFPLLREEQCFFGVEVPKKNKINKDRNKLDRCRKQRPQAKLQINLIHLIHRPCKWHVNLLVDFRFWTFCIFNLRKLKVENKKESQD